MSQSFEFEKNGTPINSMVIPLADFTDGRWSSDEEAVGNFSAVQVNVEYHNLSPDREELASGQNMNYKLRAQVETEFAPGRWHPVVTQIEGINTTTDVASVRALVADPAQFNPNPESEVFDGINQSTINSNKRIAAKVRLCLVIEDLNYSGDVLEFGSVTLSADGLFY